MKRILCILALCFTLSACEDKVNASNQETLEESVATMTEQMETTEKREFAEAIQTIMLETAGNAGYALVTGQDDEPFMEEFHARVDGKTKDEILEMANNIKLKRQLQDTISRRQRQ